VELMGSNRVVTPSDMMTANANVAKVLVQSQHDPLTQWNLKVKRCLIKYFKRIQKNPSLKLFGGSGKLLFYILSTLFQVAKENDDIYSIFFRQATKTTT
jgi:hypothetical protein